MFDRLRKHGSKSVGVGRLAQQAAPAVSREWFEGEIYDSATYAAKFAENRLREAFGLPRFVRELSAACPMAKMQGPTHRQ